MKGHMARTRPLCDLDEPLLRRGEPAVGRVERIRNDLIETEVRNEEETMIRGQHHSVGARPSLAGANAAA